MSTLSLAKNGYVSSSKQTKHIKAKYFFIRHFHNTGELDLQYCPTKQMWADVLTKPLQGTTFCLMRAFLMSFPIDYFEYQDEVFAPASNPTLAKTKNLNNHDLHFVPTNKPTDIPMKKRSLWSTPSSPGCVETQSSGAKLPKPSHKSGVVQKTVTWQDALFSHRLPTSSPSPCMAE